MATAKPVLFSGNSNPALAKEIAHKLGLRDVGKALVTVFANEESRVEIHENVRGADVFVIQSICKSPETGRSVNDSLATAAKIAPDARLEVAVESFHV